MTPVQTQHEGRIPLQDPQPMLVPPQVQERTTPGLAGIQACPMPTIPPIGMAISPWALGIVNYWQISRKKLFSLILSYSILEHTPSFLSLFLIHSLHHFSGYLSPLPFPSFCKPLFDFIYQVEFGGLCNGSGGHGKFGLYINSCK